MAWNLVWEVAKSCKGGLQTPSCLETSSVSPTFVKPMGFFQTLCPSQRCTLASNAPCATTGGCYSLNCIFYHADARHFLQQWTNMVQIPLRCELQGSTRKTWCKLSLTAVNGQQLLQTNLGAGSRNEFWPWAWAAFCNLQQLLLK